MCFVEVLNAHLMSSADASTAGATRRCCRFTFVPPYVAFDDVAVTGYAIAIATSKANTFVHICRRFYTKHDTSSGLHATAPCICIAWRRALGRRASIRPTRRIAHGAVVAHGRPADHLQLSAGTSCTPGWKTPSVLISQPEARLQD